MCSTDSSFSSPCRHSSTQYTNMEKYKCVKISPVYPKFVKMLYYFLLSSAFVVLFYQTHIMYKQDIIIYYKQRTRHKYGTATREIVNVSSLKPKFKYLLLWTHPEDTPFVYFGEGSSIFQRKICQWTNCYVTGDRNFLGDYTKFDAIVFSSSRLSQMSQDFDKPTRRSKHQKYVFASVESSANYPICSNEWNDFFNWTWTYKLNSDAVWGYMVIQNATGHVIGPNQHMQWIDPTDMEDIDRELWLKLQSKNKVAAWFVSNCDTQSLREEFVQKVNHELNKYKLDIHVFGSCGKYHCPKKIMSRCLRLIERDYYFYLAFENSFSEDYVTEKLMYACQHNTVPIVYGGANYSRFLPKGSYLDALQMGPVKLAKKIFDLINSPKAYAQFFRWKKHYTYHYKYESPDTDDYCRFCAMLNDDNLIKRRTIYTDMRKWWTGIDEKCAKK